MAKAVFVAVSLLLSFLGGHALEDLSPTAFPPPPPMVHCCCSSYPKVARCSWPEPTHSSPVHYIATYRETNQPLANNTYQVIPPVASSSVLDPASSQQMWHFQLPNLKLFTDYIVNITAVYPSNSHSSHLSSFMLEDIVKPDPPVDLRVSPKVRSVLLEWSPPLTWDNLDIFPLKYQIRFQWNIRGKPKFVNIGPFETTSAELRELRTGRPYVVQVCAQELLGLGECSEWSEAVNVTIPKVKL